MKNAEPRSSALLIIIAILVSGWITCAAGGAFAGAKAVASRVRLKFDQLPLHFIENAGQVDAQVRYYVQGSDKTFYFTAQGVTVALEERGAFRDATRLASVALDSAGQEQRRVALKLDFIGASADAKLTGEEQAPALINYFKGPQEAWKTGLKTYKKLVYRNLWPGIDLIYSGTVNRLKYMFVVRPGADPDLIRLAYRGADAVNINNDGRLEVQTGLGGFHDEKPTAYQPVNGEEVQVAVAYQGDLAKAGAESFRYGFRLGSYDASLPLVIDPAILIYSGFIGGSATDRGNAIAVDTAGSAYVTGETSSLTATFPLKAGPDVTHNGGIDAFVAKVAPDGETLLYAGFVGAAGTDRGTGIAVDGAGNAYVVGETNFGVNFPNIGALGPTHNGGFDAFVAKVNPTGTALIYAGFIGGVNDDRGNAIALEQACAANCAAYITGETSSAAGSFPDTVGPDVTHNGGVDAFAAKINAAGSALVYAGYIGGSGTERGKGIAVDGGGSAYVTGETDSLGDSFPDGNGFSGPGLDQLENGALDAFIVKINPAGSALVFATFVGGSNDDRGNAIALEPGCASDCAAYITGESSSDENSFPVAVGPDVSHNGGIDAFVAKLAANGSSLVYAGYIGGVNDDRGNGIAVDSSTSAHVTGETNSDQTSFPDRVGPDLTHNGLVDGFVAQLNPAGSALVYAGFIGGLGTDRGKGIALDSSGAAFVVGETNSDHASFPKRIGPDTTQNGDFDAFVAKFCVSACADVKVTVTDAPNPVRVGENVTYTITITNDGPDAASDVTLVVTLPSTATFLSSVPGAPTCTFTVTVDCNLGDLNDGVSTVVSIVVDTTAKGTLRLTAAVSADETDTDASNNQETETTTATFSNLVLRALTAVKAALPGTAITIDETTKNRGLVDAQASFTRFYLSDDRRFDSGVDALLGSRMIPALVARASNSGSTMVTIPGGTALGRYFIIGLADADNTVTETAENNRRNRAIQITRPDLQVANLRAPGSAAAGAAIAINDTTHNKSPLDAGASTTRFFLSADAVFDPGDTPLINNSRTVPALPANGKHSDSTTATIPGVTVPGKYFLIAVADADSAVMEADETDNTRKRRITITP